LMFIDLIMDAAFKTHEVIWLGTNITLARGQCIVSRRRLAVDYGTRQQYVGRWLLALRDAEMLELQTVFCTTAASRWKSQKPNDAAKCAAKTGGAVPPSVPPTVPGCTLVTICNYDKFQPGSQHSATPSVPPSVPPECAAKSAITEGMVVIRKEGKETEGNANPPTSVATDRVGHQIIKPPPSVTAFELNEEIKRTRRLRDPKCAIPDNDVRSADAIDRLLQRRDPETVLNVIRWCQRPLNFWGPIVDDGIKLAHKFDTMYGQMTNESEGHGNGNGQSQAAVGYTSRGEQLFDPETVYRPKAV